MTDDRLRYGEIAKSLALERFFVTPRNLANHYKGATCLFYNTNSQRNRNVFGALFEGLDWVDRSNACVPAADNSRLKLAQAVHTTPWLVMTCCGLVVQPVAKPRQLSLAIPPRIGKMSTGDDYSHRQGRNGEFCVTVGPVTRTADILTQSVIWRTWAVC